jgi:hypothetical protein
VLRATAEYQVMLEINALGVPDPARLGAGEARYADAAPPRGSRRAVFAVSSPQSAEEQAETCAWPT